MRHWIAQREQAEAGRPMKLVRAASSMVGSTPYLDAYFMGLAVGFESGPQVQFMGSSREEAPEPQPAPLSSPFRTSRGLPPI